MERKTDVRGDLLPLTTLERPLRYRAGGPTEGRFIDWAETPIGKAFPRWGDHWNRSLSAKELGDLLSEQIDQAREEESRCE